LPLGTFISVGRSLDTALDRVRVAERLGYHSVFTTHVAGRDSLTVLGAYATVTESVRLGTGVLPIYSRTPAATAQQAVTIDEMSRGRLTLGVGVSHQVTVENWYGSHIGKPTAEMRDYVAVLRAIFAGEDPPESQTFPTRFHFLGVRPRADLPIYLAGLSPRMLELAGEVGDGVILWLCNPDYIRDVVVPHVREGRRKAGKKLEGFDIVAAIPTAVTDEVDGARATLRADLSPYFLLPFYRHMIERSGYDADVKLFDEAMERGDASAAAIAISDGFLENLAAIGPADIAAAAVERYRDAGATSPCIGPIPGTDFETALESLAELAHA
jgi:alkanesulfonate monooxygenase SsuD/methylene tetrahydromethanopterin reductase-like flavin-dependent oxidoreductase (luciferase family)